MTEAIIRDAFAQQARWSQVFEAPALAQLCARLGAVLDRSTETGRRVLDWPGEPVGDALALRLAGGLNALRRAGRVPGLAAVYPRDPLSDEAALDAGLREALRDDTLPAWLDSAPQTNEVGRAAGLYAGLLEIAHATGLPLALLELGSSAGLNLRLDAYRHELGGRSFGAAAALVTLAPRWRGPPPPEAMVTVASRRGVDLAPLDVTDAATRARLLAYVWPEQGARVARLEAALAAAALDPPPLDRGDAADWVETRVRPAAGVATVVFHSVAWQYFPAATQARIVAHLAWLGARATAAAPLAWLRYEPDEALGAASMKLRLRQWPGGDRLLASVHPHGSSIVWFDQAAASTPSR